MIEKEKKILQLLSSIYLFLVVVAFPLIVDKTGYFYILECKWHSFLMICVLYIVLSLSTYLYFLLFKKTNYFKNYKFNILQYLALALLIINIISCFISPYFKEFDLFVGVGRGEGLIMTSLYILSFICLSLFMKFDKKYISFFSISSIMISIVSIMQHLGFNPFNLYQETIGIHNVSFTSTIGNVDFVSAIYTIFLPISIGAFIFLEDNKALHIMSIILSSFVFLVIDVQSGRLAMMLLLAIVFPFIIKNNKRLSRTLIVVASSLFSASMIHFLNPIYSYFYRKISLHLQIDYTLLLFILVITSLLILSKVIKRFDYSINKKGIISIYISMLVAAVIALLVVYFYDFKAGFLYEIHSIMHGKLLDEFGTYRIFLWKRAVNLIKERPLLGSGPDTFAVRFMSKYTNDVIKIGEYSINDTAANEFLTMTINIGLIGALTYISFLICQIKTGISKMNDYSKVLLMALLCYIFQSLFNLSVVVVAPLFWVLMATHISSTN